MKDILMNFIEACQYSVNLAPEEEFEVSKTIEETRANFVSIGRQDVIDEVISEMSENYPVVKYLQSFLN